MSKSRDDGDRRLATWMANSYGVATLLALMYGAVVLVKRGDVYPLVATGTLLFTFIMGSVFGKLATQGGLFEDDDKKGMDDA